MPSKKPTVESLQAEIDTINKWREATTHDIMELQEDVAELEPKVETLDQLISGWADAHKALAKAFADFKNQVESLQTPAGERIAEIHELLINGTPEQWEQWRENKTRQ